MADTYSNHNGPHNVSIGYYLLGITYLIRDFHFQHNHPYLSAMINNGSVHYDHDRDGTHTMIGGCEVKFRNFAHDTYLNIRYENDVLTGKIQRKSSIFQRHSSVFSLVTHDLDNKRAWAPCFRVEGVKLPTGYYFGASAATGM